MKALSLTQPWSSLVALGFKSVETRSWQTSYRGRIAIHAALNVPVWVRRLGHLYEAFAGILGYEGLHPLDFPRGKVVATARLVDCIPTEAVHWDPHYPVGAYGFTARGKWHVNPAEMPFGDYSPGRYAWLLADIERFPEPIPAKGARRLWNWEAK